MPKSADAFRTISEVADWLETPAHVLRFWESKFSHVKPVKRAGGRRYYRPADMMLLGGIKKLLHDDGMTIKGVQKVLREQGVKHVSALSQPLDEVTEMEASEMAQDVKPEADPPATVLSFKGSKTKKKSSKAAAPEAEVDEPTPNEPEETVEAATPSDDTPVDDRPADAATTVPKYAPLQPPVDASSPQEADTTPAPSPPQAPVMPSFLQKRGESSPINTPPATPAATQTPQPKPQPALARIDVPHDPPDDITGPSGALSAVVGHTSQLSRDKINDLRAIAEQLKSSSA